MHTMMDVRLPFLHVSQFCWESADNDGCQMIMNSGVKKGGTFMVYNMTILTSRPVCVFWNWFGKQAPIRVISGYRRSMNEIYTFWDG